MPSDHMNARLFKDLCSKQYFLGSHANSSYETSGYIITHLHCVLGNT